MDSSAASCLLDSGRTLLEPTRREESNGIRLEIGRASCRERTWIWEYLPGEQKYKSVDSSCTSGRIRSAHSALESDQRAEANAVGLAGLASILRAGIGKGG